MYDNYNYPMGADTPSAPWNEVDVPEIEVDVEATVLMKATVKVYTDNYSTDCDGDIELHDRYADIERLVKEQHKSIPQLLAEFAKYIRGEMAGDVSARRRQDLEAMLADCEAWSQQDIEIEDYSKS